MLIEIKDTRQIPGEGHRRWFTDPDMDLVVWYQDETRREINGFQLSFDKRSSQHALTWSADHGFRLNRVDDGEADFYNKMTPVLVPAAGFDGGRVGEGFAAAASGLEYGLVSLVRDRLAEFHRAYGHSQEGGKTAAAPDNPAARLLLDALRDAFYGPGLHGPSLLPSLLAVPAERALWQAPVAAAGQADGFSAWQLALHCAFWKRSVTRQIQARLSLPETPASHAFELADWAALPAGVSAGDWRDCLEGLRAEHEALVRAAARLAAREPALLFLVESASGFSWGQYLYGMAAHDVYHTAQLRNLGIPGLAGN